MYYWLTNPPPIFTPLSYPTYDLEVDTKEDLRKWVDFGNPTPVELTKEEEEYVKRIKEAVERLFPNSTTNNLSGQIKPFRAICQYNPKTIFEIGPGHGYLGALLGLAGYTYASVDIIKGFHYWQQLLWKELGLSNKQRVPWFHQTDWAPVDLVYANAVFAEMTPEALEHNLKVIQGSTVMYMNLGAEYGSKHFQVEDGFKRYNINAIQI